MNIPLTIFLIFSYIVSLKIISIYAFKKSSYSLSDYYLVDRKLKIFILLATILATTINGLAVTAVPAQIYEGGILFFVMYIVLAGAAVLMYIFGPKINSMGSKYNLITPAELFYFAYKSYPLRILIAIICLVSVFPFLTIQFSAIGKIMSFASVGVLSYDFTIIITSLSVGIYLIWGGSRAVVWTDVFQGILLVSILIITAFLFTNWSGGLETSFTKVQSLIPEKLTINQNNQYIILDRVLSWSFAFFLWPQTFQRMFMAKDQNQIKKTSFFFWLVTLFTMTSILVIGVTSTANLANSGIDKDQFVIAMFDKFWPIGSSFLILLVFACGMSTIDSILLSISSIISRDFTKQFLRKNLSEKQKFNNARIISVIVLIITTVFALSSSGRGAIAPLVTIGASFATLLFWPLLGVFYFKISRNWIFFTLILGLITIVTTEFKLIQHDLPYGSATLGFVVCLVSFLLGAIAFRLSKNNQKSVEK